MRKPIFELKKVFSVKDYFCYYKDFLKDERTKKELDFIEEALKLNKNMKILDLCCGHGRISNPLAACGYDVTGLDITKGFLNIAKRDANRKKLKVKYVHGDMRKIPWKNHFDVIINIFTSFGYFDDKINLKILKGISQALKNNGRFLIDHVNRDYIMKNYRSCFVTENNRNYTIDINEFDCETSRNYTKRTIVYKNGRVKHMKFFVRMYTFTELKMLLESVGLKILKAYGDAMLGSKLRPDSKRMIIIAKKI